MLDQRRVLTFGAAVGARVGALAPSTKTHGDFVR
jgi:hypothetical protein